MKKLVLLLLITVLISCNSGETIYCVTFKKGDAVEIQGHKTKTKLFFDSVINKNTCLCILETEKGTAVILDCYQITKK